MALDHLGPYKLDRVLGRGGMGAVYAGLHRETNEWAAVKVLSAAFADDGAFRDRFKAEIETLKKLSHPNIVQLHGFGEEEGHLFYVMALVDGRSLQDDLVKRRRLPWQEVTRIGIMVARALKHAHDRGIVHRDLKPANLLVDREENVKLTDFGIAKLFGASHLTMAGGVIGTADYMAPEQADGTGATIRSDLYSLGNVLYALLAGNPPFTGKNVTEVLHGLRTEKPIDIQRLCHDIPEELGRIVMQLLEKDPQKRIPTALAVANRLQAMEHALGHAKLVTDGVIEFPPEENQGSRGAVTEFNSNSQVTAPFSVPASPTNLTGNVLPGMTQPSLPTASPQGASLAEAVTALDMVQRPAAPEAGSEGPARGTHFTQVSEAELRKVDHREQQDEEGWPRWIAIGLMALGVLFTLILIWRAFQPVTSDELYRRIHTAADSGEIAKLLAAELEIDQFLTRFADDPRVTDLVKYREEIELYRLQRQFELRGRNLGLGESLLPVERAYLEALRLAPSDPEGALRKFQAIETVFAANGPAADADQQRVTTRCVELARKQGARLEIAVAKSIAEQQAFLRARLEEVARLSPDDAARATAVLKGIIELYKDRPWAEEIVAEARQRLGERSTNP